MGTFPHLFVLTCYLHIRWNASIIYLVLNDDSGLSMLPWVIYATMSDEFAVLFKKYMAHLTLEGD